MAEKVEFKNDVEYRTNADKGVVVCKLHNCRFIALDRINKQSSLLMRLAFGNNDLTKLGEQLVIDEVYVGIAYCSPDDTFDENIGKKIALTKAKRKRCQAVNKVIKEFMNVVEKELNRLKQYGIHEVPVVEEY